MTTRDAWDPGQYDRFAAERRQPFVDLLALCRPVPGGTIVDLGCGPGGLTVELHRALGAAHTTGIDLSAAMLAERAERHADVEGVSFEEGDLAAWSGPPVDLVAASASLHWVPTAPRAPGPAAPGGPPGRAAGLPGPGQLLARLARR